MANNLRMLRDGRGWTQGEAAAALGTTRNQYAKLEGGSRRLSDKWIKLASDAYGVDPGEVVTERAGTVPVVGYVGAGTAMHFYAEGQGPLDEVPAPEDATPLTVAAEIRGDSLGPIFAGWRVFYDDRREAVTDDLIGRLCIAGLADGRVLVKKVLRGRAEGRFDLHGQFGEPVLDAEVLWAAKVTGLTPA
ncbi:helix-turn-helix domain-containing protein [Lichenibacterium dinghuense]|uniref:helix-turn-helix domain-containing protein n=1 Tax=Lichenibacterium dinghuense TaxID=2895977 RepID=UPI001F3824BA|nr:helix-turn-helix transcriptional regulator [Lichenibacterium sp. 6Y81]